MLQRVAGESWLATAKVAFGVTAGGRFVSEKSSPQRTVRHEPNPQAATGFEHAVFGFARPQRVLTLQRGDRVHGVGPFDRRRGGFGDAEEADLARVDERLHCAPGLFNGDAAVDAVLVVEVNHFDVESRERRVTGGAHVLGRAVDAQVRAVLTALVAELRREHHLVATSLDGRPDESFVGEGPVHVGGVQERDARIERFVDRRDRLRVVPDAVELTHPHAAESLRGDLETLAQCATFHDGSFM